jgi:hypothetical protein
MQVSPVPQHSHLVADTWQRRLAGQHTRDCSSELEGNHVLQDALQQTLVFKLPSQLGQMLAVLQAAAAAAASMPQQL